VLKGTQVEVKSGTTNGGFYFMVSSSDPIVIGTSAITFTSSASAGASATAAAASASTATTQAGLSQTARLASETAQGLSEDARDASVIAQGLAEDAQAAAEAVLDNFDDRYLGAKAVAPTLDNDGNPLQDGSLYYDTVLNLLRVYDLGTTTWISLPVSLLASLTDVELTAIASGELLVWNGTKFINQTMQEAGIQPLGSVGSFKNKIIGGNFTTNPWQRGTSFTAPATGAFTADRFKVTNITAAVVDVLKTADAPTVALSGIYSAHCLHLDVTTADASLAAGDIYIVRHIVEGFNASPFGFGQSGSRNVTLSFAHKHTKTGTHCVALRNSAGNRSYIAEYTQAVTDTWEWAEITIPVDTSGTWLYDSGVGIDVDFTLASGTTFQTAAGAWTAGNFIASANQVNNLDSTANNFKIDLLQLEEGSSASDFETRSIAEELKLCRRTTRIQDYYVPALTAQNLGTIDMRAVPTITGGGAGFTSTGTTADQLIAFQTGAAVQTLTLVSEP
jgi:hypothetical protein